MHRPRPGIVALLATVVALAGPTAVAAQSGATNPDIDAAARLFERGDHAAAKSQLVQLAKSQPQQARVWYYLGRVYLSESDGRRAADAFEHAVRLQPETAEYYKLLGEAYGLQAQGANRFKQASLAGKVRGALENAVRLDPSNVDARLLLAQFYIIAPGIIGGSLDRARAQATEIKKLSPMQGRVVWAAIYEKQKDVGKAQQELEAAVAEYPDSAQAYYRLAQFYRRTKQWDNAFALLDRLKARRPDEFEVYYHIGSTGAQSGQQLDRAEEALKAYLARPWTPLAPTHASAHYRLGNVYERKGERERARREYQEVLRLNPQHSDAKAALSKLR